MTAGRMVSSKPSHRRRVARDTSDRYVPGFFGPIVVPDEQIRLAARLVARREGAASDIARMLGVAR